MKKKTIAVVIISNGPGELSTWVRPLVDDLNELYDIAKNPNKSKKSIETAWVISKNTAEHKKETSETLANIAIGSSVHPNIIFLHFILIK